MIASPFATGLDEESIETGTTLVPKFDADGLIVAIASLITLAQALFAKSSTRRAPFFHDILTFVKGNRVCIAVTYSL